MPFGESRLADFDQFLKRAGVPISGLSINADAPAGVHINFLSDATQEQRDFSAYQKDHVFDWRPREPLDRNQIMSAFNALPQQTKDAFIAHAVSSYLRDNAIEAEDIAGILGASLPVDQVVPT